MESWIMDARYAARRLLRRPLYALLSVLTLALGIGGIASVYGIARPILLDPLPYKAEEGLAAFWPSQTGKGADMVNAMPKYIGSNTLSGDLQWNAALLEGDLEDLVPKRFTNPGQRPSLCPARTSAFPLEVSSKPPKTAKRP